MVHLLSEYFVSVVIASAAKQSHTMLIAMPDLRLLRCARNDVAKYTFF